MKFGFSALGRAKLGDSGIPPVQDASLDFITTVTAVYTPRLDGTVEVPFISSVTTVFSPILVSPYIDVPFISSTAIVYTPVIQDPYVNLIFLASNTSTFTLTVVSPYIDVPFISSSTVLYDIRLQIDVPFISSVTVLYTPFIQPDFLDVPYFSVTPVLYPLTLVRPYLDVPFIPSNNTFYPPTLQSNQVLIPFIPTVSAVYALIVEEPNVFVPYIISHTIFYDIELNFHVPFIPSVTHFFPLIVQPDFVEVPFIASKTRVKTIAAIWVESTGAGNGGETFPLQLSPSGTTYFATLTSSLLAAGDTLHVSGESWPSTGQFCVQIDDEVMYVTKTGAGTYHVINRGLSNTLVADHLSESIAKWTDKYDMAIVAAEPIAKNVHTSIGLDPPDTLYRGWLVGFDSSQGYIGTDRYPAYVYQMLGVFEAGTGIEGVSKIDGAQPSAVHVPIGISDACPAAMNVPALMIDDVDVGDAVILRYKNEEASVLSLGHRSAGAQSYYAFERRSDTNDVVTLTDPNGHIVDGTATTNLHDDDFVTVVLPGDDRTFTYGPPRFSDKGWPIGVLAVRQGKRRVPHWVSPDWHNFRFLYTGFDTDATFIHVVINRNGFDFFDPEPVVDLPGAQDIPGPNATWDDDRDYYFSASWYVGIFGGTSILGGPGIGGGGGDSGPPPIIPGVPPGSGGDNGGGGPPVEPPDDGGGTEGGEGGDIPPVLTFSNDRFWASVF